MENLKVSYVKICDNNGFCVVKINPIQNESKNLELYNNSDNSDDSIEIKNNKNSETSENTETHKSDESDEIKKFTESKENTETHKSEINHIPVHHSETTVKKTKSGYRPKSARRG
jgi:hypothetical protein